jgi:hypothetical protein
MTGLLCACPVTIVQAVGAVRATGLFWVAVLKRDLHALGWPATRPNFQAMGAFPELMRCPARKRRELHFEGKTEI